MSDENVLREFILAYFSDSEMRTLCADLGLDYDSLPGTSKADKARELVGFCARRNDLDRLADLAHSARPGVVGAERSRTRPNFRPMPRQGSRPMSIMPAGDSGIPGVSTGQIDRLTNSVDHLNESLSSMRTSVALLAQRLDAMETRMGGLETSLEKLSATGVNRSATWQTYLIVMLGFALAITVTILLYALNAGVR